MAKLYVFGIGGTGSRVLRSLTMLMAAGVPTQHDIVPIIIDPDESAEALTYVVELMRSYRRIRENLHFDNATANRFFRGKIKLDKSAANYRLPLQNTKNAKFGEFIGSRQLDASVRALVSTLFSNDNLEADMAVGFKGNPNIGSVVLNQFAESQEFQSFVADFQADDRIFIISSIFGGTGASGFPLLAKLLRNPTREMAKQEYFRTAPIGALTVLPYFNVSPSEESSIDSATFIGKAKAALDYYLGNIIDNHTVNSFYTIGDIDCPTYDNVEGGAMQKNPAHFIELASALAVLDFDGATLEEGVTNQYEFGVKDVQGSITSTDLGEQTRAKIQVPLYQFALLGAYFKKYGRGGLQGETWAKHAGCDATFFSSSFFSELEHFMDEYHLWLDQMAHNAVSFAPIDLDKLSVTPFEALRNQPSKRVMSFDKDFTLLGNYISSQQGKKNKSDAVRSVASDMIEYCYRGTREAIQKKLSL